ncbi:MAG: DUF975 family protein [Acholeplasmatales bacterium]|nr:MAG: DUF975 family protein [Acholeplasmatales bacterium]
MAQTQSIATYKNEAKEAMQGQYPSVILYGVMTLIILSVINVIGDLFSPTFENFEMVDAGIPFLYVLFNLAVFAVSAVFAYGYTKLFYAVSHRNIIDVKALLRSTVHEQPLRSIGLRFFIVLFLSLWAVLFIIPAIIKNYAYAMSFYNIMQGEQDPLAAITTSREQMHGHKATLFTLDLSYLGWYILGIFTFGLLYIWIIPRHMTARMLMFNDLYEGETVSIPTETRKKALSDDPFAAYER